MRSILAVAGAAILLVGFSSLAAAQTDVTVKDFLAACSEVKHVKHQKDSDTLINCQNEMMFSEMAPDYCPPSEATADTLADTVEWLKRHPEMSSMERDAGIRVALKAMYCR
jgi:hypothetical protein